MRPMSPLGICNPSCVPEEPMRPTMWIWVQIGHNTAASLRILGVLSGASTAVRQMCMAKTPADRHPTAPIECIVSRARTPRTGTGDEGQTGLLLFPSDNKPQRYFILLKLSHPGESTNKTLIVNVSPLSPINIVRDSRRALIHRNLQPSTRLPSIFPSNHL